MPHSEPEPKRICELNPEQREGLLSWMFADECGIVDNDTRTYTVAFWTFFEALMSLVDPERVGGRDKYEAVISQYMSMSGKPLANLESLKALSLAALTANQTIAEKKKQGMTI